MVWNLMAVQWGKKGWIQEIEIKMAALVTGWVQVLWKRDNLEILIFPVCIISWTLIGDSGKGQGQESEYHRFALGNNEGDVIVIAVMWTR